MIDRYINEYIRLVGSVTLPQSRKNCIEDFLLKKNAEKKESTVKYFAAASAVAVLAISSYLIARGKKQDLNVM